ncbi:putative reverse transcriptase domain, reverse transcriptase zinc-binding domain protein, partial [Tanacetum coccineum]
MECVTTTSFSISINGSLHGHFKGRRGLRQGDPISPYLFTIVVEVLTLMLKRQVREGDGFTFHRFCSEMEVINVCFADDLFLFAHGDVQSAKIIMESLDEFKLVSGLTPSLPKSTAYFCNVLPFEEGRLPVKYLGVPLVPSRLVYNDCKELIEKASVFILPTRILLDIEQLMRGFLWCQRSMRRGKAKVAWDVVCLPKDEGGLGVRRLDFFNKALMSVHIWKLLSRKDSLWVEWIHLHKIKNRNFWDIPCRGNMTWGWRKILQLRPCIREFIWHNLGDGMLTSLWYDKWCSFSLLADFISSRDVFRTGLNLSSTVADVLGSGSLVWPHELEIKYPILLSIPSPRLSQGVHDK